MHRCVGLSNKIHFVFRSTFVYNCIHVYVWCICWLDRYQTVRRVCLLKIFPCYLYSFGAADAVFRRALAGTCSGGKRLIRWRTKSHVDRGKREIFFRDWWK